MLKPSHTTPSHKDRPLVGVGIIVIRGNTLLRNELLLGKRLGTLGHGTWAPPGGHLEYGESLEQCAKRELAQKTGLTATDIQQGGWTSNIIDNRHYITLWAHVTSFSGTPIACEPAKCASWQWFSLDKLPNPLFPSFISFQSHVQSLKLPTEQSTHL